MLAAARAGELPEAHRTLEMPLLRRTEYSKDMCPRSLDILARTVSIGINPDHERADFEALADKINSAAEQVLAPSV